MYKVIPFLILFISFFYLDVSAQTVDSSKPYDFKNGLLDDVNLIKSNTFLGKVYDNDDDSSVVTGMSNGKVVFKYPVKLDGMYIHAYNYSSSFHLQFEDGKDSYYSLGPVDKLREYVDLNYSDVVSITFSTGLSGSLYFNELEFFGSYEPTLSNPPVSGLNFVQTFNSVDLTWTNPSGVSNIIINKNGVKVADLNDVESYTITGLNPETDYNIEVIAKYPDGSLSSPKAVTFTTNKMPDDINPPGEISNLAFGVSATGVAFSWFNPPDTDFSHVRIYRDNQLIEASHTQNEYKITGLTPNTTYVFKFVTVDKSGNNSMGYIQTVKTDPEVDNVAPAPPTGINVTNGSASGSIRWDKNSELDLLGYNVYVDGIKHNSAVIMSTTYAIANLTNDQTYDISVSAVDTSFNESVLSAPVDLTPFAGGMPVMSASYDLKLVADGTSSWFNAFWPILAFAVGIPLAFYVSNRVKTLFFA